MNIFPELPKNLDAVFLPVNGVGNNMNISDAKQFAKMTEAKKVIPIHWGMFDELDVSDFDLVNAIIPKIYEEVQFE